MASADLLTHRERSPDELPVAARALAPAAAVFELTLTRKLSATLGDEESHALDVASRSVHGWDDELALWRRPESQTEVASALIAWARRENPALGPLAPLTGPDRVPVLPGLGEALIRQGSGNGEGLADLLLAPSRAHPTDLFAQLAWVLTNWPDVLDETMRRRLLRAQDGLAEAAKGTFDGQGAEHHDAPGWQGGTGPASFSDDRAWMRELVLVAKHTRVWLHQLSARFGRDIRTLDAIPDEALDQLVHRGFNGLWLIGLWARSPASAAIKRERGVADAVASAYALEDYAIASELGGEGALQQLRERCTARGLRLAADMVPNHVGIDGRWVAEHPDWFVQVAEPPFPGCRFTGPNLSGDARIEVRIEDGYWRESDAAVVFERRDATTGETRYLYHGNDGTRMPWNDTAQLDYLKPEVREAVLDTIVDVARRFPVIRFDAAMTLARRHVQRLWHPAPGDGGAIPSRAERAASPEAFDAAMPEEFWREVVTRIERDAPDTLLLAEAFWMMEGVFVRDFGMHRVYNSAFMHMLRDGDNAGYRALLAETLAEEPRVLERLVSFMNNPDEESARDQFGDGDRFFAVSTLMATLPGLPMFGHGQVEGLAEKYGMEFSRPRRDEQPSDALIARHDRELRPLLERRSLFASAESLRLFDVVEPSGRVSQDVFAFSQRRDGQRALVLVNNSPHAIRGRLSPCGRTGASLAECLGIDASEGTWWSLKDHANGGHRLCHRDELTGGLPVRLEPWAHRVTFEIEPLADDSRWARLAAHLDGRASADLHDALESLPPPRPIGPPADGSLPPRAAGLLLHPTSLPGPEGIGTLGASARALIDWMAEAGLAAWQVLPLCAVGGGASPYTSPASLLGNPLLIDLRDLAVAGLLSVDEAAQADAPSDDRVDFEAVRAAKMPLLRLAAQRLRAGHPWRSDLDAYRETNAWLADVALFQVLHDVHEGDCWWRWPAPVRDREPDALAAARAEHADATGDVVALSFLFDRQWARLRRRAEARGITLVGDLPIYVAHDSADVWVHRELFELDDEGQTTRCAGVPPDAFSDLGQRWGNPLYDWQAMDQGGYRWWVERMRRNLAWTPQLRIDHFRAFSAYWAVPGDAPDARTGEWVPGPGVAVFDALTEALGPKALIAEDLGDIDEPVHVLRREVGHICMRVLQFGYGSGPDNIHRAERCDADTALYTGTHDNDTTLGWWREASPEVRADVRQTLGLADDVEGPQVVDALIEHALASAPVLTVFPAQDLLRLGSEARMNTPGTADDQWQWRMTGWFTDGRAAWLHERVMAAGR